VIDWLYKPKGGIIMSQTIDIFLRQVIENHSNMADNDILDLEYVPEKTSRFEKAVTDVSSAEAKPVQASKDARSGTRYRPFKRAISSHTVYSIGGVKL
jgi:hypothetical protein